MLLESHQQLRRILFELYIYQDNILLKKDKKKQLTHIFLEFNIDQE